jgi:IS1 family transposase
MNKSNVYNWLKNLKKMTLQNECLYSHYSPLELDELYWFVGRKSKTKTRENVYVMTMISARPRQIVGVDVAFDKEAKRIQNIVDISPKADEYCTDGYLMYCDVVYYGKHNRNVHDKKDTHNVESINADLRHYIPLLRRRSKCFARSLETLKEVVEFFVQAYNAFGLAKLNWRQNHSSPPPFAFVDFV